MGFLSWICCLGLDLLPSPSPDIGPHCSLIIQVLVWFWLFLGSVPAHQGESWYLCSVAGPPCVWSFLEHLQELSPCLFWNVSPERPGQKHPGTPILPESLTCALQLLVSSQVVALELLGWNFPVGNALECLLNTRYHSTPLEIPIQCECGQISLFLVTLVDSNLLRSRRWGGSSEAWVPATGGPVTGAQHSSFSPDT